MVSFIKFHAFPPHHSAGRGPAVRCRIKSMKKRVNTPRPYDWIFYHLFEMRTPTNASTFIVGQGLAPAVLYVI